MNYNYDDWLELSERCETLLGENAELKELMNIRSNWFSPGEISELREEIKQLHAKSNRDLDCLWMRNLQIAELQSAGREYRAALEAMTVRGDIHDSERLTEAEKRFDALLSQASPPATIDRTPLSACCNARWFFGTINEVEGDDSTRSVAFICTECGKPCELEPQ